MPFIHRLKEECVVHDMESQTDYRRLAHHHRRELLSLRSLRGPRSQEGGHARAWGARRATGGWRTTTTDEGPAPGAAVQEQLQPRWAPRAHITSRSALGSPASLPRPTLLPRACRGLYFVTPDRDQMLWERFIELTNNQPVRGRAVPPALAMGRQLGPPRPSLAKFFIPSSPLLHRFTSSSHCAILH